MGNSNFIYYKLSSIMGPMTTNTDDGNAVMGFTVKVRTVTTSGQSGQLARVEVNVLCFDALIQCTETKPEELVWIYA